MRYSDLIVPHGAENDIAIQFISENLKNKLMSRGIIIRNHGKMESTQEFRIMFDVIDDVLLTYQKYSKQIYTIKNQFKDEHGVGGNESGSN